MDENQYRLLETRVRREEYVNPDPYPYITIAIIECTNGYILVGKSVSVPSRFEPARGRINAKKDALRQLYALEGYLGKQRYHEKEQVTS